MPDVAEQNKQSPRLSAARYRAREQNVVTSSGDSGHIASDPEEEPRDEHEDTLKTEGSFMQV